MAAERGGGVLSGAITPSLEPTSGFPGEQNNFSIDPSSTCFGGVAAGASCQISARFAPGAGTSGLLHGTLRLSSAAAGAVNIPLTGTAVATAASLRIGLRRFGDDSDVVYGTGGTIGTNSTGFNGVEVWLKNIGDADAQISNSPVTVTFNPPGGVDLLVDNTSTCPVAPSADAVTQITFTNTTLAGGSECHMDIEANGTVGGAWITSFTIAGTPGGSVNATVTGI